MFLIANLTTDIISWALFLSPFYFPILIPNLSINNKILLGITIFLTYWISYLNCNPYPLNSNKYTVLENIPSEYLPKQRLFRTVEDIEYVASSFKFPIIIKPLICTKLGKGIIIFKSPNEFKVNAKPDILLGKYMVQEVVEDDVELGVLVEKWPFSDHYTVVSVVQKVGSEEIRRSCESMKCIPRNELISILTPHLERTSRTISNFNVGRYDILSTNDKLLKGQFKILEVNGTIGFDLRSWTSNNIFWTIYCHSRWWLKRLFIGITNILMLRGYNLIDLIKAMYISLINTFICKDFEKLYAVYT